MSSCDEVQLRRHRGRGFRQASTTATSELSSPSTRDEGHDGAKLAGVWGGSGSGAYQQTQQNWQTTAAEIEGISSAGGATGDMDSCLFEDSSSAAIVAGWDILKQAPFSGSGVGGPDDLVLEDSSSEERVRRPIPTGGRRRGGLHWVDGLL